MGIKDAAGKVIVAGKYDFYKGEEPMFVDGLVALSKNGKWGFVDATGKEVIPLIYDKTESFNVNGEARVLKGNTILKIDKTGKEITGGKTIKVR